VKASAAGVNINNLRREHVLGLPISLPPLAEQGRIVAKLDELRARSQKARAALDAVPALLDKLKQSVLAAAFRGDLTAAWRAAQPPGSVEPASQLLGRIRAERQKRWEQVNPKKKYVAPEPVDTDGLPELPEGWLWCNPQLLFGIRHGFAFKSDWYTESGVPVIRQSDLTGSTVSLEGVKYVHVKHLQDESAYVLNNGDLLIAMSGSIGKVAKYTSTEPALQNQRVGQFRWYAPDSIPIQYLEFFSQTYLWRLPELGKGVAVQNISSDDVFSIPIPIGPQGEMVEIGRLLGIAMRSFSETADASMDLVATLVHLDQSILAKAFRGELVPQDPNDEPAETLLARIQAETRPPNTQKGGRVRRS
jgi:type I restriction enzyme S subunit